MASNTGAMRLNLGEIARFRLPNSEEYYRNVCPCSSSKGTTSSGVVLGYTKRIINGVFELPCTELFGRFSLRVLRTQFSCFIEFKVMSRQGRESETLSWEYSLNALASSILEAAVISKLGIV